MILHYATQNINTTSGLHSVQEVDPTACGVTVKNKAGAHGHAHNAAAVLHAHTQVPVFLLVEPTLVPALLQSQVCILGTDTRCFVTSWPQILAALLHPSHRYPLL